MRGEAGCYRLPGPPLEGVGVGGGGRRKVGGRRKLARRAAPVLAALADGGGGVVVVGAGSAVVSAMAFVLADEMERRDIFSDFLPSKVMLTARAK